jgi:hypothetical protein
MMPYTCVRTCFDLTRYESRLLGIERNGASLRVLTTLRSLMGQDRSRLLVDGCVAGMCQQNRYREVSVASVDVERARRISTQTGDAAQGVGEAT